MLVIRSVWVYEPSEGKTLYKKKIRIEVPEEGFKKWRKDYEEAILTGYSEECIMFLAYVEKGFKLKDKGYEK